MDKRGLLTLIMVLCLAANAYALPDVAETGKKILIPDWLKQSTMKWGFAGTLCTYQALNGAVDGYHFRKAPTHMINSGNYHAFVTAQRITGITTGWFGYANFRNPKRGWLDKAKLFIGSALVARNCFEWSYKGVRYGDPFDYSEIHNEHALVYFGFRGGKITDLYIGTGPVSGPIVDAAFFGAGLFLLMW